jgi:hypothetical protein
MEKKPRKKHKQMVLAGEEAEQIRIDPIAAAERYRVKLQMRVDEKIQLAVGAVGDQGITFALIRALEAWRILYAFSHALSEATGRRVYEVRWVLHEKLPTDYLKRRLIGLRHAGGLAPVQIPELGLKILSAIEATQEPKAPVILPPAEEYPQVEERIRPSMD